MISNRFNVRLLPRHILCQLLLEILILLFIVSIVSLVVRIMNRKDWI